LAPFYIHQMNGVNSRNGSAMMTAPQTLPWLLLLCAGVKEAVLLTPSTFNATLAPQTTLQSSSGDTIGHTLTDSNCLMALYPRQPRSAGNRTLRNITQRTTFVVLKFLTSIARPPILPLGCNTRENPGDTVERNMENPRTPNAGFDDALGQSLVHCHSRLSLYDHYQACSSHTDESQSKPSHAPQGISYTGCPPCCNPPYFGAQGAAQNMLDCIS